MSIPSYPEAGTMRQFRNAVQQLKKAIQNSNDLEDLNVKMEEFVDAYNSVSWPHKASDTFHKDEKEKIFEKFKKEYQRYINDLQSNSSPVNNNNLLQTLGIIESFE